MINRPVGIQRLFAGCLILFIFLTITVPIIGFLFGLLPLVVVLAAGIRNPHAKASSFDRKKISDAVGAFNNTAGRIQTIGQRFKGAQQFTARAPGASLTAKTPKTSLRLGISAGAESVPVVSWLPLNIINTVWTFWDLRKGHREARKLLAIYEQGEAAAREAETERILQEKRASLAAFISQAQSGTSLENPAAERNTEMVAARRAPIPQNATPPAESATRRPVVRDVGSGSAASRISSQTQPAVPATARA
jgi:hypothetical protein